MFPIRDHNPSGRTPYVTYALIAANFGVFVLGYNGLDVANIERIDPWMLQPTLPHVYQFITSVFLHADWMHLGFNMYTLWIFGPYLEIGLGPGYFLLIYFAAIAEDLGYDQPVRNE